MRFLVVFRLAARVAAGRRPLTHYRRAVARKRMKYRIAGLRAKALSCDVSINQNKTNTAEEPMRRCQFALPGAASVMAALMDKTGTIKRRPDKPSELFFGEAGELNGR
jgi:hypothetical protein